jgi:ELWxxDGT repeat protein
MSRPRLLEPLESRTLLSAQLVADLNPAPGSSNPTAPVQINGVTLFPANGNSARAVWRTDGTPDGTTFLSAGALLGTAGNFAYINPAGSQIIQTDGTSTSTIFNNLSAYPTPDTAGAIGSTFYFAYTNRLFKIASGIVSEVRLSTTYGSANFSKVVSIGSKLFLYDTYSTRRIWVSDGTTTGTRPLSVTLDSDYPPGEFAQMDGALYFTRHAGSTYELWKTLGTDATTSAIATGLIARPTSLTVSGHTLFFWGGSPNYGQLQLWKSDGTAAGTTLVSNVPLPYYSSISTPPALVASGSRIFFNYNDFDPADAYEANKLWVSDGTAAGTREVRHDVGVASMPNTWGGALTLDPADQGATMFDYNGTLLFQGYDAAAAGGKWSLDFELWTSDGTAAGTKLVSDIVPGAGGSAPRFFGFVGSQALISITDPQHGREPWLTDGTAQGTHLLKELNTGTADSNFTNFAAANGRLLVSANNGVYVVDSPQSQPRMLAFDDGSLAIGRIDSDESVANVGSQTYFIFYPTSGGTYDPVLCVTDGTPQGTRRVKSLQGIYNPKHLTAVGDRVFFTSLYSGASSLYVSDGSDAGTVALAGGFTFPGVGGYPPSINFAAVGDVLYFAARIGTSGAFELWKSDGTPQGTVSLVSFPASAWFPSALTAANGRLYFLGGGKFYQTDGTPAGTTLVGTGTGIGAPYGTAPDGSLLLANQSASTLMRLGPANATPTKLADVVPVTGERPVRLGKWLYFIASPNGGFTRQLWRTDGTPADTTLVVNTTDAADLTLAGHLLYYTNAGYNPGTGNKLYATDGTPAGTYQLPGTLPSPLMDLTAAGDTLYFTGLDGIHGRELWRAIDDVAPAAVASSFNFAANPQTLTITFTQSLADSLTLADWKLTDRATGQDVSDLLTSLSFNPDTDTATLTLVATLPKGNYRLTLPAGAAADPSGNPTAADVSLDFFHLPGDINRDRSVNFDDLLILAKNYNKTAVGYTNGDLNGDGVVNFDDLLVLAKNYNATLPPLPSPAPAFSTTRVVAPNAATKTKPSPVTRTPPKPVPAPPAPSKRPAPAQKKR